MSAVDGDEPVARLVDPDTVAAFDQMGPTIQVLELPDRDDLPCVMRGVIPPGVMVPLHSHVEPETFVHLSGGLEGLVVTAQDATWVRVRPGEVFHVPCHAKHAWRNLSTEPAVSIVISTPAMGRFFLEAGTPVAARPPGPPSAEVIQRFLDTATRYGYWTAGPEENERVGITLPMPS